MQSAKDAAAAAKVGMEKAKAAVQEKGERMTTRDPVQKEMATQRKEERQDRAELEKQEAKAQHTAEKHAGTGTGTGTGTGGTGTGRTFGAGI